MSADDEQRAAIDHRGGVLRVLGAPRTGKTETAVAIVLDRVRRGELSADEVLLLAATRQHAGRLRRRVMTELGGTATTPVARTASSLAFGILRQQAALLGEPPPRLLNGPEQDIVIRDLLAGHAAGEVPAPPWPERVQGALATRAFRAEVRDLFMRAVENSLGAEDLLDLAAEHDVPEWRAAAHLLEEYDRVTALASPGAFDPAWIVAAAHDALVDDAALAATVRRDLRLIVVDDAQELTPGAARLLSALVAVTSSTPLDVVLLGDPDLAVQGFRGADPGIIGGAGDAPVDWTTLTPSGQTQTVLLDVTFRPQALLTATRRVADVIGTTGTTRQREVVPADTQADGSVETHLLRTPAAEAAFVASRVRQAVLHDDRNWSDVAVIVRGQGRSAAIRRALARADIPVAADVTELPVRDEPAVRPLLQLLSAVLDGSGGAPDGGLTPELVVDLLGSRLGSTDAVLLRRLRRVLRQVELRSGSPPSDELLVDAIRFPVVLQTSGSGGRGAAARGRLCRRTRRAELVDADGGRVRRAGVHVEDVLWQMWSALGLATRWRRRPWPRPPGASRPGPRCGARALRRGVPVRGPVGPGRSAAFLAHIDEQEVPGDTLAQRSPGDSVSVLTPPVRRSGVAGRRRRRRQEGTWPDTRVRGLILRSSELVDRLRARPWSWRSAVTAIRHDESRLFYSAASRATAQLIVTAVRDETEQPSPYLEILDGQGGLAERELTEVERPTTSRELTAWLRRQLVETEPAADLDPQLVTALVRLADEGVPGAHPGGWWALRGTTATDRWPLPTPRSTSRRRASSPSRTAAQWLLTTRGGDGPPVGSSSLGTLIHDIARDLGDARSRTRRRGRRAVGSPGSASRLGQ